MQCIENKKGIVSGQELRQAIVTEYGYYTYSKTLTIWMQIKKKGIISGQEFMYA